MTKKKTFTIFKRDFNVLLVLFDGAIATSDLVLQIEQLKVQLIN